MQITDEEKQRMETEDRLTDVSHADCLRDMTSRLWGLRAAIYGLHDAFDNPQHLGVLQLADDILAAMEACVDSFDAERKRRNAEAITVNLRRTF